MADQFTPPPSNRVRIYTYLKDGATLNQTAKALQVSYSLVRKYASILVMDGLLRQTCKYPVLYARKRVNSHPDGLVGDLHPTMLPHKFGASFFQYGKPSLKYEGGMAIVRETDHVAIFRRNKATIWLKHFVGSNVNELVVNGESQLRSLGAAYSNRFGIKLELDRVFQDIEWVDISKERSRQIADSAQIAPHTQRLVAGAFHKFKDATHPESLEINAAAGFPKTTPTEQAKVHEFIYSGKLADLLEQIGNSIVIVNQKVELIAKKLKNV